MVNMQQHGHAQINTQFCNLYSMNLCNMSSALMYVISIDCTMVKSTNCSLDCATDKQSFIAVCLFQLFTYKMYETYHNEASTLSLFFTISACSTRSFQLQVSESSLIVLTTPISTTMRAWHFAITSLCSFTSLQTDQRQLSLAIVAFLSSWQGLVPLPS